MAPPEVVNTRPCPPVSAFKERPILFSAPMVRALLDGSKTQTRRVVKHRWPHMWQEPYYATGKVLADLPTQPGAFMEFRTRRQDDPNYQGSTASFLVPCPYGRAGDRLWVRETYFAFGRWETRYSVTKGRDEWHFVDMTLECGKAHLYAADAPRPQPLGGKRDGGVTPKWWKRPAIFMPRAASRIDLEETGMRVERLQDISEGDALAEGITSVRSPEWDALHWSAWRHAFDQAVANGTKPPIGPLPSAVYCALWEDVNGPDSWALNLWVWVVAFRRLPARDSSSITTKETP